MNWNGRHYLEQFLPSVTATTYTNHAIVIADNASTDDSVDFIRKQYPQLQLIQLPKNLGFAGGYNAALKEVEAEYFVLLNSDVEVEPGWLQPAIRLLESDPAHAACQPKILSWHHRDQFEYAGAAGGWIDAYGYPFARGRIFDHCETDNGQYNKEQEIFWASGAAMIIRRFAFMEVDGFYDYLFAHQEEIDLCWRLKEKGYKIWSCPASVVYHVGGGTLANGSPQKTYLNFRNNQVIMARNLPASESWWKLPLRMGLDQISAVKELLSGDRKYFRAVVRAHLHFIGWLMSGGTKEKAKKKRSLQRHTGVYRGNIVWEFFVKGKKRFAEIVED